MTMNEIEKLAERLAEAREELSAIITRLQHKQNALQNEFMPSIKKCVGKSAERHTVLFTSIHEHRELFEKPKSQVFHGLKLGLRKGAGGITWDDDEAVCARIEKLYSRDEAELLVKTTKKPIKAGLNNLDVADLKKLGCTVEATGDVVFIKPVDSAVDKIVNALLKSAVDEAQKEAA